MSQAEDLIRELLGDDPVTDKVAEESEEPTSDSSDYLKLADELDNLANSSEDSVRPVEKVAIPVDTEIEKVAYLSVIQEALAEALVNLGGR